MPYPSDYNYTGLSKAHKIAICGVLTALALIFSYVEVLVPLPTGIPGIKLGLANIVVLLALYTVGTRYAFGVNILRVFLSAMLFGSLFSALYALSGALLSFGAMVLLKRTGFFSAAGVSMAGGVFHNLGQLGAACIIMETAQVMYYFPVLLFSGMVCGILTGIIGTLILRSAAKTALNSK